MLKGQATAEQTKAYADRMWAKNPRISPNSWRIAQELTVGKIGLGTYRMGDDPEHKKAMEKALLSGINLIDTSTNYMDGKSEHLIGETLGALCETGKLKREEVVLVSKAGYMQGKTLLKHQHTPPPETIQLDEHLWHCIHPDFLKEELENSLKRLGVECIDIYMLHNPEYFLQYAYNSAEDKDALDIAVLKKLYYTHIEKAFTFLEQAAHEGKIQYYGVSSNTFGAAKDKIDHTDLAEVFTAAQNAAQNAWGRKKRPLFRAIELPYNLLELGVLKNINTEAQVINGTEEVSTLELATRMHLTVLTNRPLNAFPEGNAAYRLSAGYKPGSEPMDIERILPEIHALEESLATTIGGWPMVDEQPLFHFGQQGDDLIASLQNAIHFDFVKENFFMLHLSTLRSAVEQIKQEQHEKSAKLDDITTNYALFFNQLIAALREKFRAQDAEHLKPLEHIVRDRLKGDWKNAPMQQVALNAAASTPGVTSVLCGLRDPAYIQDVTTIYEQGDFVDVATVIGSNS